MKRSALTPLSRLPRATKKSRPAATARRVATPVCGAGFTPATPRPATPRRTVPTGNPVAAARAARSAYFNAFCAFLSPSQ